MLHRISIILTLCACAPVAGADVIVLANGDELNGEIVEWAVDHVLIAHPQLGQVRLSLDQLAIDTGQPPNPGLFGTRFLRGWNRSIDLGLHGERGTTETSTLTAGLNFNYRDEFKRWRLRGRYFLDRDGNSTSDNNSRVDLTRDWLIPSNRWFMRTSLSHQFDEFESWEHRIVASAGPGYRLIERPAHALDAIVGPAFTREFGERDADKGEGVFGLDYKWQLNETVSFEVSNQFFVEATPNAGEIRNLSIGEWKLVLAEKPGLNLKMGIENEYESSVEGDDEKNNLKYYMTIGLDF